MNTILLIQWMIAMHLCYPKHCITPKQTIDSKSSIDDSKMEIVLEPFPDDLMNPITIVWEPLFPRQVIPKNVTEVDP